MSVMTMKYVMHGPKKFRGQKRLGTIGLSIFWSAILLVFWVLPSKDVAHVERKTFLSGVEPISPPAPQKYVSRDAAKIGHIITNAPHATSVKPDMNSQVVRWEGPALDYSSFAVVSRELGFRLVSYASMFSFEILPSGEHVGRIDPQEKLRKVIKTAEEVHKAPAVVIRMSWPPNFTRPEHGKLIVYLPWEFYGIPNEWVEEINNHVTEVWVPSTFDADSFVGSGVMPEKIAVVPHGINFQSRQQGFKPSTKYLNITDLSSNAPFVFLYHGGALWRKGADVLIKAYLEEFTAEDDVMLYLLMTYGDAEVFDAVHSLIDDSAENTARIRFMTDVLPDEELDLLYQSVDAYAHPARGEGFGLTIANALAKGIPVITTNAGGHMDYVSEESAFLVNGKFIPCHKYPCSPTSSPSRLFEWKLDEPPLWYEPDLADLQRVMRLVHINPQERARRSENAQTVMQKWTWDAAGEIAAARISNILELV